MTHDVRSLALRLKVPAHPQYFRLCRLLVAGLGERMGLLREVVDDLKLAVTEACVLVSGDSESGSVECTIRYNHERIDVDVTGPAPPAWNAETSGMGLFFIQSLMDDVEYRMGRGRSVHLTMTRQLNEASFAR